MELSDILQWVSCACLAIINRGQEGMLQEDWSGKMMEQRGRQPHQCKHPVLECQGAESCIAKEYRRTPFGRRTT